MGGLNGKKLKFLLLIRRKEKIEPKKVQLVGKKSFLWFRAFRTCFWEVEHPLCDVFKAKTQILTAHQKEDIDRTQKSFLVGKKSSLWFRAFRTCFWEVDHPLCDVFKAKNSNSYRSTEGRQIEPKKVP